MPGIGGNTANWMYAIGDIIYAATDGGLSISTDGGTTFTNATTANGLGNDLVRGLGNSSSLAHSTSSTPTEPRR